MFEMFDSKALPPFWGSSNLAATGESFCAFKTLAFRKLHEGPALWCSGFSCHLECCITCCSSQDQTLPLVSIQLPSNKCTTSEATDNDSNTWVPDVLGRGPRWISCIPGFCLIQCCLLCVFASSLSHCIFLDCFAFQINEKERKTL